MSATMAFLPPTTLVVASFACLLFFLIHKWTIARRVLKQFGNVIHNTGAILPYHPFSGVSTVLAPWFPFRGLLGSYYESFDLYAKHGTTCLASVEFWSSVPVFWVADAEISKIISTERSNFPKDTDNSMYEALNLFGENIITTEGHAWKRHRTVARPAFNEANNTYVWQETICALKEWFVEVDKSNGSEQVVDLVKVFTEITMSVICAAGFGQRISRSSPSEHQSAHDHYETLSFEEAVVSSVELLMYRAVIPDWVYTFCRWFRIPGLSTTLNHVKGTFDVLQAHLMELISLSRASVAGEKQLNQTGAALLRNLVEANMNIESDSTKDTKQLTDRELLSDVFIFLAAGRETSSHTLAFAVTFLALYPGIQQKIYDEVAGLWPDKDMSTDCYQDFMPKLTYTNAVFNETLRFFSPAARLNKRVEVDATVKAHRFKLDPSGSKAFDVEEYRVPIPKGSHVIIDVFGLHMNPLYWGEDVHEFNPDRFIDTETYRWPRDAFMAFSVGSRRCIGERFAVTESVCLLAHLVRRYEILVPNDLRFKSSEDQRKILLAFKPWITTLPLNAKSIKTFGIDPAEDLLYTATKRKLNGEYGDWRESESMRAMAPPIKKTRTAELTATATGPDDDWFADPSNGYVAHTRELATKYDATPVPLCSDDWFVDEQNGYNTTATRTATQTASIASKSKKAAIAPKIDTNAKRKAPKEKRGARFRSKCPQNIIDRVRRVREQRFFMISRQRKDEPEGRLREDFEVLGSTGNVYTVTIAHAPSCTCPDAVKGNLCKHILFIFLKVLQVSEASGYWYQKALLTEELETIFREAPQAPNAEAHPQVKAALDEALGRTSSSGSTNSKKKIPTPEDDCPVCYESMCSHGQSVDETKLVWCEECGNALHSVCFDAWRTTKATSGMPLTCVYCRGRWAPAGASPSRHAGVSMSEGYVNLSGVAGLSPVRDTSSYYQGPRRGQRYYGYQDYY